MGNVPKVSIVMPVYNEELYLDNAIQSVRNQSLTDIEIICVNDGSTDDSMNIISRHAEEDKRIVVIDKENTGYGNSMNLGIVKATGEYVGLVETDDYVSPTMFQTLYNEAKKHDLDFIKSDHYKFMEDFNGNEISEYYPLTEDKTYYNRVINPQEELGVFDLIMMTWSGIYKRSFLIKNDIRHNETPGASFQDNGFWFQVFTQAERAYFINKAFYMLRRDNPNSSVKSRNKVYAMSTEYDLIGEFLSEVPERMEKYKYVYQHHRCIAYHFTLKRIARKFVYEFLHKFSSDFKEPMSQGLLRKENFNPLIWKYTNIIVNDPDYFYCWKYYNPRYENEEPHDLTIRYYKTLSDNYRREISHIKNSIIYRMGTLITYIPKQIQKMRAIHKDLGFGALKIIISRHIHGDPERNPKILFVASDNNAHSGAFLSMSVLGDYLQTDYSTDVEVILPRKGTGKGVLDERSIKHSTIKSYDWVVSMDLPRNKKFNVKKKKEHLWNWLSAIRIAHKIRKDNFDIVHINTSYAYVGALAASISKRPVVWHLREFLEEDQGREIYCKDKGLSLIQESDRIVAISDAVYNKYRDRFGKKLVRIYNGIDARDFYAPDKTILFEKSPTFIFVGGLSARKGCFFLIKALEEYSLRGFGNFRIIIIGRGNKEFRSIIENSPIKENIEYLGYQKNTDKYYQESDIAFTCSDSEAFGRVTVEAMLSGCLVIAANSGGTSEIISDGETGLLYDAGDVDGLIESINTALANRKDAKEIAASGRTYALNNFSADVNADKISDLYSTVKIRKKSKFKDSLVNFVTYPMYATASFLQITYESVRRVRESKKRK